MHTRSISPVFLLFATIFNFSFLVTGAPAQAGEKTYRVGHIVISQAWAKETPRAARTGAAYFTIANDGSKADYLVSVTSPIAQKVSLHAHRMIGNTMGMAPVLGITVPAGQTVTLKQGGRHVMLIGLTKPIKDGDKISLVLSFKHSGSIKIIAVAGLPPGTRNEGHGAKPR